MYSRYIIALLFMCLPILSFGQDWEVISFKEDPADLSARTQQRVDKNENPCALIKISMDSKDVKFFGDIIGEIKNEGGYWLVYVPEGTRYLTIIENNLPIELDFSEKDIDPKQKVTYILALKKKEPYRKSANLKALAMSIVPGVGLMQKGRTGEGVGYLISDVALIGGGIAFNVYGNQQKKKMNDINSTIDQYRTAKNNYDSARTGSYICYGTAIGVYILNLVRSYVASPKPNAPLKWSIAAESLPSSIGSRNNLAFNVSLCYTF